MFFQSQLTICVLFIICSFALVDAFTTPRPTSLLSKRPLINNKEGGATAAAWDPSSSSYNTNFDHSLNFWKQQNNDDPTTSSASIDPYVEGTFANEKDDVPLSTITLVGSALFFFTKVVQKLQIYLNTPCLNADRICTQKLYDFSKFFEEHEFLSFMMILTHSIPFVLLPWVSKQISDVGPTIKRDFEGFNPFLMQMAFACIGFGLSLEFGWHVADSWYYENNFHVLNFGFYFFLISGFALWADGFRNIPIMDLVFGLILAAATALYPLGNEIDVAMGNDVTIPEFLEKFFPENEDGKLTSDGAKIPLYAGMTATFLSITRRGREIFGNSMLWVPFFCIVVNLSFIFALDGVQYGNAEVVDGEKVLTELNYIYHICHDILGTELGVLVFGLLIKNYVPLAEREAKI